jgi:hypothetical protein
MKDAGCWIQHCQAELAVIGDGAWLLDLSRIKPALIGLK